jgi:(R,R)-butanediol dehydrogenase/meso-butanediol dehydrogenase/diacetyl reductase
MSYPGGLAERLTVPAAMAIPASADIASDLLALSEPFAVAVRAIRRSRLTLGETVTVVGGGTIGLAVLQVARAAGSGDLFVVEPRPTRRTKALHVGASRAAEAAGELGLRSDVVIDCTGSPAGPAVALSLVRSGGRIVVVGLPTQEGSFDFLDLVLREVAIVGSVGHVYDEDFTAAVDLICSGRVNAAALITDRLALDDGIDRGIRRLAEGEDVGDALKILIRPN